jgi:hypothetical protein
MRRRAVVLAWYAWTLLAVASVAWVCGFGWVAGSCVLLSFACAFEAADLMGVI